MSQQDDGLLREVEEELRRERLEKIWKDYGTFVIAAAVAVVLGVMGYKYWESHRIAAAYESGSRYEEALNLLAEKKTGSADVEFEKLSKDGPAGYRALSLLQLAGSQSKEGKKAEALATYDSLANDNSADTLLRSFARLQAAGLRLGEADFTEMENRLTPLMGDDDPWRFSARELLGLAAYKAGKLTDARAALTPLFVEQEAPQSITERAQIIMAEIAARELAERSAEAPAGTATESTTPAPAATTAPSGDATAAPEPSAKKD
ncbi:MAG TPA: tetratricopeptide repeat protein [Hyphomicrobium sp.]|nr:tetratricopeptide repeat protein [Hyphomicrobium sp.]